MRNLPYLGLGLGMTMQEAVEACKKYLDKDPVYSSLDFINLGFFFNEDVPPELPELLDETGIPVTLHAVDINLSEGVAPKQLELIAQKVQQLNIKWIVEDLGIWVWDKMYLGFHQLNPIQDLKTARLTADNIRRSQEILGCEILVENAPAYFISGDMDIWDYLLCISEESDCGIALDVGHMMGLLVNSDKPLKFASSKWKGWNRVAEIHLSGFDILKINGKLHCLDSHHLPFNPQLMEFAAETVNKSKNLKSILLELEYAPYETISDNLQQTLPIAAALNQRNLILTP